MIGRITDQATADEIFRERVCAEAKQYLSQVREATAAGRKSIDNVGWPCRLFPFKSFTKIKFLANHVDKQHGGGMKHPIRDYVSFSRNFFNTFTAKPAPWDLLKPGGANGVCLGKEWGWRTLVRDCPLAETAGIVRAWNAGVDRPEAFKWGCNQRDFRALITEKGGRLLLRNHPEHLGAARITSHTAVSPGFIRALASAALLNQGRPKLIREKLVATASLSSQVDGFAEALPGHVFIGEMVYSIFHGESIVEMIEAMRETVGRLFHEFSDLSLDATVNIMQSIVGNIPKGKTGSRLPEQERCLTS